MGFRTRRFKRSTGMRPRMPLRVQPDAVAAQPGVLLASVGTMTNTWMVSSTDEARPSTSMVARKSCAAPLVLRWKSLKKVTSKVTTVDGETL
jgi:hypothetical protein